MVKTTPKFKVSNSKKSPDIPTPESTSIGSISDSTSIGDISSIGGQNGPITPITYNGDYDMLFQEILMDRILKHFFKTNNKPITVEELSKVLGEKKDSITAKLHSKKEYFSPNIAKGKKRVLYVVEVGIQEINQRIARFESEKKQKINKQTLQKAEIKQELELERELLRFTKQTKTKREGTTLPINFNELLDIDYLLADKFLANPEGILKSLTEQYDGRYNMVFTNLPQSINIHIECLRHQDFNKLSSIEGRLTSFGEVRPVITQITFECPSCGADTTIKQDYRNGHIIEPEGCLCGRRSDFKVKLKKRQNCSFLQLADLQEKTDNPSPERIKAVIFDGLCEGERIKIFTPGNEIKCYGILKAVPVYKKGKKTLFEDFIFEILDAELIEKEVDIIDFTEEEVEKIKKLSKEIDDNGLNPLIESFAPDVYGYDYIKQALALQLCNKRNDPKNNKTRNKSNILMIGDPGVAKSVLGNFAMSISRGGRRAVGGGSSAVGITASVVREEESIGGYRVEPGALILAKDLLFLDEMNNLQEEDKSKLQEGMSEQKISINKANIHCEMKVTCGIIAAANPKHGNFTNTGFNIEEQFNIPTPILNRFDTIFVFRDVINESNDKKIASRMIKRHSKKLNPIYEVPFLRKFFVYIKKFEEPEIDEPTEKILEEVYLTARKFSSSGVKINPRFLESINRMSIALAKIRLSFKVELKDIERALSIIEHSQYNVDAKLILREISKQKTL